MKVDSAMKSIRMKSACAVALLVLASASWGQSRIYRCGNEYTNNAAQAKKENCRVVEGGSVTVVHTQGAGSSRAGTSGTASGTTAAATSRGPASAQVSSSQQQVRDNDARAILQAELAKAQERLAVLKTEYNDGQPAKTALEESKPELYQARAADLKARIARQESDVQGIERELSRLPGQ